MVTSYRPRYSFYFPQPHQHDSSLTIQTNNAIRNGWERLWKAVDIKYWHYRNQERNGEVDLLAKEKIQKEVARGENCRELRGACQEIQMEERRFISPYNRWGSNQTRPQSF